MDVSRTPPRTVEPRRAAPLVTATAAAMALGMFAFAVVNVVFEATGAFADRPDMAAGLAVMNWLVFGLKLLGVAVAVLSVTQLAMSVPSSVMTVLLWGAFALLAIYSVGTVVKAIGMMTGLAGSPDQIDRAGILYLLGSVYFAVGFGVLAISYSRRHGLHQGGVLLGVLGAPALLAGLLVAVPALLTAAGLLPDS
ncbi:hypothetical protein [Intrasporangium sp.]|uniref:hypothetical protein n=1 Tax=Intrasporangium sp. TaxID=1925024 RepID=UPI002939F99E|nr:hypothetical protein [Intrasporangium sp.]MDV3221775.1 hypothetical protein [Intrasporangium sp.]